MNDNNKLWTDDETLCLLDIWGSKDMQDKLATTKRNRLLWEDIARLMARRGYQRSNKQCGGKIHNMKVEYRKVKYYGKKPHHAFKYFDVMDAIMTKQEQRAANESTGYEDGSVAGGDTPAAMKYETATDNESMDDFFDEDCGESLNFESKDDSANQSTASDRFQLSPKFNSIATSAKRGELICGKRTTPATTYDVSTLQKRRPLSSPDSTNSAADPSYDLLATVLDKVGDMQKQSDERYYAWEEKRLRTEREFEERRQQREMEREAKRDEFFVKMAMILTGQQQQQQRSTENCITSPTPNALNRQ